MGGRPDSDHGVGVQEGVMLLAQILLLSLTDPWRKEDAPPIKICPLKFSGINGRLMRVGLAEARRVWLGLYYSRPSSDRMIQNPRSKNTTYISGDPSSLLILC